MSKEIKIMIVEDERSTLKGLCTMLQKRGYNNIVCGANGEKAWSIIQEGNIGLLITDWNLPGLSGLKILQKIRTSEGELKDMPVILITADDAKPNLMAALRWKVNSYIIKPVEEDNLIGKIEEILNS